MRVIITILLMVFYLKLVCGDVYNKSDNIINTTTVVIVKMSNYVLNRMRDKLEDKDFIGCDEAEIRVDQMMLNQEEERKKRNFANWDEGVYCDVCGKRYYGKTWDKHIETKKHQANEKADIERQIKYGRYGTRVY